MSTPCVAGPARYERVDDDAMAADACVAIAPPPKTEKRSRLRSSSTRTYSTLNQFTVVSCEKDEGVRRGVHGRWSYAQH